MQERLLHAVNALIEELANKEQFEMSYDSLSYEHYKTLQMIAYVSDVCTGHITHVDKLNTRDSIKMASIFKAKICYKGVI